MILQNFTELTLNIEDQIIFTTSKGQFKDIKKKMPTIIQYVVWCKYLNINIVLNHLTKK
jgi:hypothetical protein